MPISETTFADRLGRAQVLSAGLNTFSPAFDPADTELEPAAFSTFLADLTTLNGTANSAKDDYSTAAAERVIMVKDIKTRALRAFRYVQSNPKWGQVTFPLCGRGGRRNPATSTRLGSVFIRVYLVSILFSKHQLR
jgi:hypothetical protein